MVLRRCWYRVRPLLARFSVVGLLLAAALIPAPTIFANPGPPFVVETTQDWNQFTTPYGTPPDVIGKCISDSGNGTRGPCTLRAAATAAGQLTGGPYSITVPAGTYVLTHGGLGFGGSSVDIQGACCDALGNPTTIVDGGNGGNGATSLLAFADATPPKRLSNVVVRNWRGGGVFQWWGSTLNLEQVLITGIGTNPAIDNRGIMNLTNVTVTNNTGTGILNIGDPNGAANAGVLTGTGVSVVNNTVSGGVAGVRNYNGELSLSNSDVSNNTSSGGAGVAGLDAQRDGMNAELTLDNVTITGNVNDSPGGYCCGFMAAAGLHILDMKRSTLSSVTIQGNQITGNQRIKDTGGMYLVLGKAPLVFSMRDSIIDSNSGDVGGVYATDEGAALTITRTAITNNSGDTGAGGLYHNGSGLSLVDSTIDGNSTGTALAAGVVLDGYLGSHASVSGSTISNNAGPGLASRVSMEVTNSTVSGNTGDGADLNVDWYARMALSNLTIAFNTATGLGYVTGGGQLQLRATIIGNNTVNCAVAVPSQGNNLEGNDSGFPGSGHSCGFASSGDLSDRSPLLGPLAANGGPTLTHALVPGSPAIDAVLSGCPPPVTDQRGAPRPYGPRCDIGAFEFGASPPAAPALMQRFGTSRVTNPPKPTRGR